MVLIFVWTILENYKFYKNEYSFLKREIPVIVRK